jgi:hypothetical protein
MKRRKSPRKNMDDDPDECWKYLLVYTDDILCISHDAREVIVTLEQPLGSTRFQVQEVKNCGICRTHST